MSRQPGQSLAEYALIGALVAVVAIPALGLLAGNLGGGTAKLMGDIKGNGMVIAPGGSGSGGTGGGSGNTPYTGGQTLSFTTQDGTQVSIENYPSPLSSVVATSGANGATSVMASQIEVIAKQLLEAGEITQEQATALFKLANQGHYLASIEQAIETSWQNVNNGAEMENLHVRLDGKTYHVADLGAGYKGETSGLLGFIDGKAPSDTVALLNPKKSNGNMQTFTGLYQEALASGALNDPVVQKIVADLSANIVYVAESVAEVHSELYNESLPTSRSDALMASETTHRDSAGICNAGGGSDSGVHCDG